MSNIGNQYGSSEQFSASAFISQNFHSSTHNSSPSPNQYGSTGNSFHHHNHSNSSSSIHSNSQNQLWMGDLDPWWDENAIKQIWSSVGENTLVQVKLIYNRNILANQSGNSANSGYCFLTFNSYQLTQLALSHNGTAIPGTNRLFKLNWALAGQQQPQQLLPLPQSNHYSNGHQPNTNVNSEEYSIFVGDLAPDVTDSVLFDFFHSQYPSCSSARIMMDQVSGNSRGYGFVKFTNELEQNQLLLEMQSAILNGRPIRVSTATKNTSSSQLQNRSSSQPLLHQSQKLVIPPQQFNPPMTQFSDSNNTTVFIGGLNVPISAEELRSYFLAYGDIVYAKVLDGKNCGFVQYVNRIDAEKAMIEMQGFPIGTSRMRLAWGQKYSQQQQQQQHHLQQIQQQQQQFQLQLQLQQQLQQQQQQQQQLLPQNTLYTSLLNHSMGLNSESAGFMDQHTYMNGNYHYAGASDTNLFGGNRPNYTDKDFTNFL